MLKYDQKTRQVTPVRGHTVLRPSLEHQRRQIDETVRLEAAMATKLQREIPGLCRTEALKVARRVMAHDPRCKY